MTHFDGFRQQGDDGVNIPPPPRNVPAWFFVQRMKAAVVCSILFPALGMILAAVFCVLMLSGGALPSADWAIDRNKAEVEGRLVSKTLMRHTHINNRHPWNVSFEFDLPSGEKMRGSGYLLDESVANRAEGDALAVEYDRDDPSHSRPAGGSAALLGGVPLLLIGGVIGAELALGLAILLWMFSAVRRQRKLLMFGAPSRGEVERVSPVAYIHFGKAHPYDVYYRFDDAGRRPHRGRLRTYRYEWAAGLSQGSRVGVVYDPYSPHRNTLWLEPEHAEAA